MSNSLKNVSSLHKPSNVKPVVPKKVYGDLADSLNSHDWQTVFSKCFIFDAKHIFEIFFSDLCNKINFYTLIKKINHNKVKNKIKDWYTHNLVKMKDRLMFFYSLSKNCNSCSLVNYVSKLKKEYKQAIKEAKIAHNVKYIESSKDKCKAAWEIIKKDSSMGRKASGITFTPDSFNEFCIKSVLEVKKQIPIPKNSSNELLQLNSVKTESFVFKTITVEQVLAAAGRLSNSASSDVYNMSNNLIKAVINSIAQPLTICINLCIREGFYPDQLKMSRVCPVYKKGAKDEQQNYRPISIIPILSKLFEILVFDQISSFFEDNKFLSSSQFGFRSGKSTADAIDKLLIEIKQAFEDKCFAHATFCDLSRAFDCVNHSDLLMKLQFYGVDGLSLRFFQSYLSNRKQKVFIDGMWSQEVTLSYGVPQGSVLGPFLFLVSINDLPCSVSSSSVLYADDTTILNISKDLNVVKLLAQNALSSISDWFSSNGFLLNQDKTKNVLFSVRNMGINSSDFSYSNDVKFLGILLDKHLTWDSHIEYLSRRLSRVIFLLKRLQFCVSTNYVRVAYFSYFQSIIRYGLVFWGNASRVQEILILQKKVLRSLNQSNKTEHCKPLFIKLKIQTIINLYLFDIIRYVFSNQHILHFNDTVHHYNTRQKDHAIVGFNRLTKSINSHSVMCLKVYNCLTPMIKKYTQKEFLAKFYMWLLDNPFYTIDEFFSLKNLYF